MACDNNTCTLFNTYDIDDLPRRSLAAQQRARQKEVLAQTKSMQNSISIGKKALQVSCWASSRHAFTTWLTDTSLSSSPQVVPCGVIHTTAAASREVCR